MINIIEIQQRMSQGFTKPWLCLGDDNKKYVVKRLNATYQGCIYEWVSAKLGQTIGLPIPRCCLVYIDESLVEYDSDLIYDLGCGIGFATEYQEDLQEVSVERINSADKGILKDLFLFDYWINNEDRTLGERGGNPNLYYNVVSKELVVFDHNLAFDKKFTIDELKRCHVAGSAFRGQTDMFVPEIDRQNLYSRFATAFQGLDDILEDIPEEWLEGIADADGEIERIKVVLGKYQTDEFWEAIK